MRFLHYWPYTLAVKGVQCKMMKKTHQKIIEITAEKAEKSIPSPEQILLYSEASDEVAHSNTV